MDSGFRGCMRNIEVGAVPVDLELIPNSEKRMVTIGACKIKDRCTPNPCEHGGRCTQDWHNFFCDCDSTGYKGSVCHVCKYMKWPLYVLTLFRPWDFPHRYIQLN